MFRKGDRIYMKKYFGNEVKTDTTNIYTILCVRKHKYTYKNDQCMSTIAMVDGYNEDIELDHINISEDTRYIYAEHLTWLQILYNELYRIFCAK
jgi:hypothetical protein